VPARDPLPRWSRWFLGVVGVLVVGVIAWGAWPKWASAPISSVTVSGARLDISVSSCGATDHRADVHADDEVVTITASAYDEPDNVDCAGGGQLTVTLDEALGDRLLVDGSDDHVLTCEPAGATVQECVR
jgi:hypothetical protein